MKRLLLAFLCAAFLSGGAADLKQWEFRTPRDLMGDRIHAYAAKGSLVVRLWKNRSLPKRLRTGRPS